MKYALPRLTRSIPYTLGLAAALLSAPCLLLAQSSKDSQSNQKSSRQQSGSEAEQSEQRSRASGQTSSSQSRSSQSQSSRGSGQSGAQDQSRRHEGQNQRSRYHLRPEGWVRVATDYDRDGQYDAFEFIYVYDLQQAQQKSRARHAGQSVRQSSPRSAGQKNQDQSSQAQKSRSENSQDRTVRGEIISLKSVTLAGMNKPNLVAKLETDQGQTATVWLGATASLEKLHLRKGDRMDVRGKRSRLNDRAILMATNVRHDGQSVSVRLPARANLKRIKGELVSKREVRFRGNDEPFVVGTVRTQSGKRELINLGPASKFQKLNAGAGDQVQVLGKEGSINGQRALIAQELQAGDERIRLANAQGKTQFAQKQSGDSRR